MSGSTSKKKAAPLCVLCQQAIEPSTAPGLWLHVTASTCGNVITDGFGVSLDETYELIDGEIFERDLVIADPPKAPDQPPEKVEVALDGGTFKLHLPVVSDVVLPKNFADFNLSVALTTYTNHEEAINMMFDDFKVPKLGGASGDLGWSSFYSFQRCPYLWKRNYLDGERFDNTNLPMPLIVGSLLHLFLALRYQIQIDLVYPINPDSAFEELKQRNVHLEALREAWRLFETYRLFYESETKFLTPLAVEYHTVDPRTKESCRYDLIATVNGDKAPLIIDASQTDNYKEPVMVDLPTGAVIVEHKCLTGDAKIWDFNTNRLWSVEEMFKFGVAPKVLAFDTSTGMLIRAQAEEVRAEAVRDVFEVLTEGGRRLRTSNNHPFLTASGWKAADQLSRNDWIAVPQTTAVGDFKSVFSDAEVRFLGYLLSEGSTSNSVTLTQNKGVVWDDFFAVLDGLHISSDQYSIDKSRDAQIIRLSINKDFFVKKFVVKHGLYGATSSEKKVPAEFFSLPDRQTALLIGALWNGDGSCEVQERTSRPLTCLRYTTTSIQLARDIQTLLLRLAIQSSISSQTWTRNDGKAFTSYKVSVVTRESKLKFLQSVRDGYFGVTRYQNVLELLKVIDEDDDSPIPIELVKHRLKDRSTIKSNIVVAALAKHKQHPAAFMQKSSLVNSGIDPSQLDQEIRWERVASVVLVGKERTYDLTVPGPQNFVANDLITHNTTSRRDDASLTGWINDGEVIGQVMLWNRLKLYRKFGPLQGVIINLLGKQQMPSMDRVFVPVNRTQSRQHTKDLKFWQAFRQLCLAQDHFPRARANCINRWGKCSQWKHCTGED